MYKNYANLNDILHLKINQKNNTFLKKKPKPPKLKQNKNNNEQKKKKTTRYGLRVVFNFSGSMLPRLVWIIQICLQTVQKWKKKFNNSVEVVRHIVYIFVYYKTVFKTYQNKRIKATYLPSQHK